MVWQSVASTAGTTVESFEAMPAANFARARMLLCMPVAAHFLQSRVYASLVVDQLMIICQCSQEQVTL